MPVRRNLPNQSPQPSKQTDLYHMTGTIPHLVEQNILQLRDNHDKLAATVEAIRTTFESLPPILTIDDIQQQLSAMGYAPLQTAGLLNTTPPDTGSGAIPPPDDGIPDYLSIVQAEHDALGIGPASTDEEVFRFVQHVAADINASGTVPSGMACGQVLGPSGGDNVFTCAGTTYRYNRVIFSNGHLFKILEASGPGEARTAAWDDNGMDPSLYSPATDPAGPC